MKRTSTEGTSDRPKRAKVETWDVQLKERFGGQWVSGGPEVKPGLPAVYILHCEPDSGTDKMAVFDMDWTIIKPKSGGKWPKGPSDWCWLYPQIPDRLKQLAADNYRLMLISNQSGIEKNTTRAIDIQQKIGEIVLKLGCPMEAMLATGESHFRKPAVGGWEYYCKTFLRGVDIDLSKSFYCGDAAGRPKDYRPGRKKDFSCSDRMFAANIGFPFHTPEEFFLKEKVAPFSWISINPQDILKEAEKLKMESSYHSEKPELVVMVGAPASGKSTFAQKYLVPHGYERVNRDELKTQSKCMEMARKTLSAKRSVVIDNTNPSPSDRNSYVELAKKNGVPCRCFVMSTPPAWASHFNYYRQAVTQSKTRRIPKVAYNMFKSRYDAPKMSEGFSEVKNIPVIPNFKSDKERQLFLRWTSEL